jgi:hypothetical protein
MDYRTITEICYKYKLNTERCQNNDAVNLWNNHNKGKDYIEHYLNEIVLIDNNKLFQKINEHIMDIIR